VRWLWILGAAAGAWAQPAAIPGQLELLAAVEAGKGDTGRRVAIATAAQWEAKRADIERRVLDIMGPCLFSAAPLDAQVHSVEDLGRYERRKVSYRAATGERIPAWLLRPKGAGPFPAMLAAHPTQLSAKDTVVGIAGPEHERYARELAERGYVVLAPDVITAGERVYPGSKPYVTEAFDQAHPDWSAMGKMCSDHRRGLDYLESLAEVDGRRLGAIGHSLGGYNSFFLAAFDARVRAAVSSCGYTPMGGAARPFAWSRNTWFVHFPKLARYLRSGILPFDFHEVLALVAPRALFNYAAAQDAIFPNPEAIRSTAEQVAGVYRLLGAEERYVFRMTEGPHEFPAAIRAEAYRWLDGQLAAPAAGSNAIVQTP
jgi:dienelactone hydrolase